MKHYVKQLVIGLSILWALVLIFFGWQILSIDPRDMSISLNSLTGIDAWKSILVFITTLILFWFVPSAILWQLIGKFERSPKLTSTLVVLTLIISFLLYQAEWTQEPYDVAMAPQASANPATDEWQCKNDIEISCVEGKCDATSNNAFTPMSVTVTTQEENSGTLRVCAYSGCWEGAANIYSNAPFLIMAGNQLPFSTDMDADASGQDIILSIDPSDGIGLIKVNTFAQPLVCKKKLGLFNMRI